MIAKTNEPQFIIDENGKRIAVIVSLEAYEELLEAAEELEDIQAYREAKARNEMAVPYQRVANEVEVAPK
jgi:PHD/YefM family antitoxin component YafN of YafNO toxin-antitoxin module